MRRDPPKPEPKSLVVLQDPKHNLEISWARPFAMALFDFKSTVSENSWLTYDVALRSFFSFLEGVGLRGPEDVVTTHLTSYLALLKKEGKSSRTIRCYAAAVSSFYDFMTRPRDTKGTSLIKSNPWKSVKDALPVIQPYVKENPLPEMGLPEYEAILATCSSGGVLDLRDRAILALTLITVRRRIEILQLRVEDLGVDNGKPFVRFLQKGGKYISIEIQPEMIRAIEAYWKASGREIGPKSHVFVATSDAGNNLLRSKNMMARKGEGPLAPSSFDRMLKTRAEKAKIDLEKVNIHVHGLRHLGARILREMGVDIKEIKERLGHAKLDTTDIYLGSMEKISSLGLDDFAAVALGIPKK